MCDFDEYPDFYNSAWRRARKGHDCCACGETIRAGDLYRHTTGKWDGTVETFKSCARCWSMLMTINDITGEPGLITLDCGIDLDECAPEDAWRAAYLAFQTPDEAQRYAQRQQRRNLVKPTEAAPGQSEIDDIKRRMGEESAKVRMRDEERKADQAEAEAEAAAFLAELRKVMQGPSDSAAQKEHKDG